MNINTQDMGRISLIKTKSGHYSLKVDNHNGSPKNLHSVYDPVAEARSAVDSFHFDGKGIIIVLGLGLGYHVAELAHRFPDAEITVVEESYELYDLSLKHGPEIKLHVHYLIGREPDEALKEISKQQMAGSISPLAVYQLRSAVSADMDYYGPILSSLKHTESMQLWDKLRYRKCMTESLTVLMIDSGYFLLTEAEKALRSNGHRVVRVRVGKQDRGDRVISGIIEAILTYKPDFLLTVNHLGLDEEGMISDFLQSIEMPVASWYVDSPNLIVKAFNKNVSPYMALFMWDRSYINDMKSMGFESVEYLPLATDEKVFRPLKSKKHKKKLSKYTCDVSFVGNSMVEPVEEWIEKVNVHVRPIVDRVSTEFVRTGNMMEMLSNDEKEVIHGLSAKEKMDFEAAVIWKATLHYRLGCMNELKNQGLRIYGDKHWKSLLHNNADIYPSINYYKELPYLFNASKINFNATSLQMKEAVNQRVFDVPACGAFLITDYQESLNELFDSGSEVVTYHNREEIPELVKYYLNNQSARDSIVIKARSRVLHEHTYKHRLNSMIEYMRQRYK